MKIGTYIVGGLIFIALVVGGLYFIYPIKYTVSLMGISLTLPIAFWIALPMGLLYIFTLLHMVFHGSRSYFKRRRLLRDIAEMEDALYWGLVKEPKIHKFVTPLMKESAALLNVSRLEVVGNVQGLGDKLARTVEWVKEIEEGKYIDLREKKLEGILSKDNPLLVQNQINHLNEDKSYASDILQNRARFDERVISKAIEIFVENEDLTKVKKYSDLLKKRHIYTILSRVDKKENIEFNPEILKALIKDIKMDCKLYMRLAKSTLKAFTPDENLELFKEFSKSDERAKSAYLYLLFEYEMLDAIKKFFEEHDENEFKVFRAYLILKEEKHRFKIDDLIDARLACHDF